MALCVVLFATGAAGQVTFTGTVLDGVGTPVVGADVDIAIAPVQASCVFSAQSAKCKSSHQGAYSVHCDTNQSAISFHIIAHDQTLFGEVQVPRVSVPKSGVVQVNVLCGPKYTARVQTKSENTENAGVALGMVVLRTIVGTREHVVSGLLDGSVYEFPIGHPEVSVLCLGGFVSGEAVPGIDTGQLTTFGWKARGASEVVSTDEIITVDVHWFPTSPAGESRLLQLEVPRKHEFSKIIGQNSAGVPQFSEGIGDYWRFRVECDDLPPKGGYRDFVPVRVLVGPEVKKLVVFDRDSDEAAIVIVEDCDPAEPCTLTFASISSKERFVVDLGTSAKEVPKNELGVTVVWGHYENFRMLSADSTGKVSFNMPSDCESVLVRVRGKGCVDCGEPLIVNRGVNYSYALPMSYELSLSIRPDEVATCPFQVLLLRTQGDSGPGWDRWVVFDDKGKAAIRVRKDVRYEFLLAGRWRPVEVDWANRAAWVRAWGDE